MEHGSVRATSWAGRLTGVVGRRGLRLGRGLVLAALLLTLLLAVATSATLVGESGTSTRITLTMPCSRVDPATVGHSAYGLDQVLTASCAPAPAHR